MYTIILGENINSISIKKFFIIKLYYTGLRIVYDYEPSSCSLFWYNSFMDLQKLLKEYLTSNKVMQLATVNKGKPWICNVYYVTDESNNIYWMSAKNRRHSKDIIDDSHVAASIVHDPDHKQAIQITGEAFIVGLTEVGSINELYAEKYGDKPERLKEVLANTPDGRAYWLLKPITISFWDEVNFPQSPKQEVPLK